MAENRTQQNEKRWLKMMPTNIFQAISGMAQNIQNLQKANTPEEAAQMLLNSGRVNQAQVNQAMQMWQNPQIRQMIQNKYRY